MMTVIFNYVNAHKILGSVLKGCIFVTLKLISGVQELTGFMRDHFKIRSEHSKIREMKNQYEGKRCFIICTGPSLTVSDLELLSNEYTFAMNSLNILYKDTDFRPSFYGCIDEGVFEKMKDLIQKYDSEKTKVFISGRIRRHIHSPLPSHWYTVSNNVAYHTYDRWFNNKFWCKFSANAVRGTYDMFSVTHFLIQIAVFMGFKEIYLLGADCNQQAGKQIHFVDYGVADTTIDTSRERNICGYEEVRKYCDHNGMKIYNATRGGELEVFERKDLDTIINKNN